MKVARLDWLSILPQVSSHRNKLSHYPYQHSCMNCSPWDFKSSGKSIIYNPIVQHWSIGSGAEKIRNIFPRRLLFQGALVYRTFLTTSAYGSTFNSASIETLEKEFEIRDVCCTDFWPQYNSSRYYGTPVVTKPDSAGISLQQLWLSPEEIKFRNNIPIHESGSINKCGEIMLWQIRIPTTERKGWIWFHLFDHDDKLRDDGCNSTEDMVTIGVGIQKKKHLLTMSEM